jgi:hypothetical protein
MATISRAVVVDVALAFVSVALVVAAVAVAW